MKKKVRVSVKALIMEEGQVLCNKYQKNGHVYYGLPGGGQNLGEPLPIALKRECLEEISTEVEVGRLRFVRDYIAQNHEFAKGTALNAFGYQCRIHKLCTPHSVQFLSKSGQPLF